MALRIEKTVFISYRRTDVYIALAVYEALKSQGYDVFFDYISISSGDFEQVIISNIRARAHFLLILTPTALDRCNEPGDWLRREIEVAIDQKRNIIPLFFKGFQFGDPSLSGKLIGKLKYLTRYNGLNVHEDYFDEGLQRLRTQYLNIPLDTVLHPVSNEVEKVVREEQVAADKALEQIEDVKELVRQPKISVPDPPYRRVDMRIRELEGEPRHKSVPMPRSSGPGPISWRLVGFAIGGLLVLAFLLWGASRNFWILPTPTSEPSLVFSFQTSTSPVTPPGPSSVVSISTQTASATASIPTIGSTTISEKDGMTLLYVPAGEFTMGMNAADSLAECLRVNTNCKDTTTGNDIEFRTEEPVHEVDLAAFWIDSTEVTNKMYAKCVRDAICNPHTSSGPRGNTNYYGNPEFDNYPVVLVTWEQAESYCKWAGRRLPTEAEWEKAARGPDGNVYPWGNEFKGELVNFCDEGCEGGISNPKYDDGSDSVAPVGSYPEGKSFYGALDMAGNVWEWVNDWFNAYPGNPVPSGDFGEKERVLRGGAFYTRSIFVRGANRYSFNPEATPRDSFGFRCAMDATP